MQNKNDKKGWMTIRVDLKKVYNCLDWDFLANTLKEVGVLEKFRSLIMAYVALCSTRIIWSGSLFETFNLSRGVRQGDLISPYLFVLCIED